MPPELAAIINDYDWKSLCTSAGDARDIPSRLLGLAASTSDQDAKNWYFLLENFIVVQGGVFDSAAPSLHVLLTALECNSVTDSARPWILEIVLQCTAGHVSSDSFARGKTTVVEDCKKLLREHMHTILEENVVFDLISNEELRRLAQ